MENFVTRVCTALHQQGWTVLKQDAAPYQLPQSVSGRYHNLPAEWVEFLSCVRSCMSAEETTWFLCQDDFERQDKDSFRWNEWELMSLQAAIDDQDAEWQNSIKAFWDNHLPVCLSVKGGYGYYAIRLSDGAVVHGTEPEFEETREAAPSFGRFLEMICSGALVLDA